MCVNTGDIYKTLAEIETSQIMSDSQAFLKMREKYLEVRGFRSRFHALVKPVTLRFVKFQLWDLRNGYISICEQDCIPSDRTEYDYVPSDIKPPPMPPEVFIHYLEHDEGDISPLRNHWLPRLPKKRRTRVITDATLGSDAWGIHIIEGPNREVVFWVCLATIAASVVAGVLWSGLRADVPGGMGIGSLAVAVPPAVLAIFLFRMGGL
ncbi:hypothetical protein M406DRAFT_320478 [Cryphonectria parasitica EP155]|uniref:Uncharacterized protein n=1 Tax=Cryphonectria parasitica (strain ATCC 38755 / EP155) TaxID=660469 RepID=A0A9P4YCY1_CRYP1|nr:uncharacterized protein M406DRAFT_320478 [Cryphonectria parasitica EP155]KAF3770699.1 hypothetical protein M406DRAFT_320478 [Cryphonectria parasitica EP155]